jgi:hypothetical protein
MMKNALSRAAAAALAASMVLAAAPAFAQPGYRDDGRLDGGPPLFSGHDDWGRGDRDDRWRRDRPDFGWMLRECSRVGVEQGWRRNYYSAQYADMPRLREGRETWELRGRMKMLTENGYSYIDTVCEYHGKDIRFEFRR